MMEEGYFISAATLLFKNCTPALTCDELSRFVARFFLRQNIVSTNWFNFTSANVAKQVSRSGTTSKLARHYCNNKSITKARRCFVKPAPSLFVFPGRPRYRGSKSVTWFFFSSLIPRGDFLRSYALLQAKIRVCSGGSHPMLLLDTAIMTSLEGILIALRRGMLLALS